MQIKHTTSQTNIQYPKTHDFGGIKNNQQANTLQPRTILPEVGITTTAEYQTLTTFIPNTAIYIAADNQMFSHGLNLFFLFFFEDRLCVPHHSRLRFIPPRTLLKDFRPSCLFAGAQINELSTDISLHTPNNYEGLNGLNI